MAGAIVLIITGILDRLKASEQPVSFPLRYSTLPVWVGALVSNTKTFCTLKLLAAGTSSKQLNMQIYSNRIRCRNLNTFIVFRRLKTV